MISLGKEQWLSASSGFILLAVVSGNYLTI